MDAGDRGEMWFWLGWLEEIKGDHAAALEDWRQARSEMEPYLKEGSDRLSNRLSCTAKRGTRR